MEPSGAAAQGSAYPLRHEADSGQRRQRPGPGGRLQNPPAGPKTTELRGEVGVRSPTRQNTLGATGGGRAHGDSEGAGPSHTELARQQNEPARGLPATGPGPAPHSALTQPKPQIAARSCLPAPPGKGSASRTPGRGLQPPQTLSSFQRLTAAASWMLFAGGPPFVSAPGRSA